MGPALVNFALGKVVGKGVKRIIGEHHNAFLCLSPEVHLTGASQPPTRVSTKIQR